jgi:glyceraldehyde-3-phosphate dehydrogenase (NADP+)
MCTPVVLQVLAGVEKLTVGRPEDNCDITPVVSSSSADFITGLVEDAQAKGATFLTPYRR